MPLKKSYVVHNNRLNEICIHCGCTWGSHSASSYYSTFYELYVPQDYCPGHEGRMDWLQGKGTTFKSSGQFKEEEIPQGTSLEDTELVSTLRDIGLNVIVFE